MDIVSAGYVDRVMRPAGPRRRAAAFDPETDMFGFWIFPMCDAVFLALSFTICGTQLASPALRARLKSLPKAVRDIARKAQVRLCARYRRLSAAGKGACRRGIYDNMKTAVETISVGKNRAYNRRFLQMCAHHLVDPVACTPASG